MKAFSCGSIDVQQRTVDEAVGEEVLNDRWRGQRGKYGVSSTTDDRTMSTSADSDLPPAILLRAPSAASLYVVGRQRDGLVDAA